MTAHAPTPTVAIIGGGFGGIGMAIALQRKGIERFTIFEKAAGVGGTWWHNTYPGAEVDTPSVLYSYSFEPWNWSRTHVRQHEFHGYIDHIVDKYDLRSRIRLNTSVGQVVWDSDLGQWDIFDDTGELLQHADFVVSAVGMLSDPKLPDWPGLDTFRGPAFHTAQWEHMHDLAGRRVAVVGSGSTAVQVVPALAKTVDHLFMFQREPGWVIGKGDREFSTAERASMNSAIAQRIVRTMIVLQREFPTMRGKVFRPGTAENAAGEKAARAHIEAQLGDRPDLVAAVTPKHAYMSKRPIVTDDFYPTLRRDNVTLVPKAVSRITETGVVDADGVEHEVDALVMSTGFKVKFLSTLRVVGRDGIELHDAWDGEPRAFLGIMVPRFPNFFIMYGPNTNAGSIITNLELQASYIAASVSYAGKKSARSIEVRRSAFERFDRWVMKRLDGTAFQYENNYFKSSSGRVSTQWPDSVFLYGLLTKVLRRLPWTIERGVGRSAARHEQSVRPEPTRCPEDARAQNDSHNDRDTNDVASTVSTGSVTCH